MGKKKATQSKKLRPFIEACIDAGDVYIRQIDFIAHGHPYANDFKYRNKELPCFLVSFGNDIEKECDSTDVSITVTFDHKGEYLISFVRRNVGLDRTNLAWLKSQIAEIMILHKLGQFNSEHTKRFVYAKK